MYWTFEIANHLPGPWWLTLLSGKEPIRYYIRLVDAGGISIFSKSVKVRGATAVQLPLDPRLRYPLRLDVKADAEKVEAPILHNNLAMFELERGK